MKKVLLVLAAVFALLVGGLFALPYFYKDELVAAIKKAANEQLTATLEFGTVNISLFRSFPDLSVGLETISVTNGPGPFEGVRLLAADRLDVVIDLWEVLFGQQLSIKGIELERPDIKVYVLSNGMANYDITLPASEEKATTTAEESPIRLEFYAIHNGNLLYDDRGLDMTMELKAVDHEGKGDLYTDVYDLVMQTRAQEMNVAYGGVSYLQKARFDWDATMKADIGKMRFTLIDNKAQLNHFALLMDGWVELPNDTDLLMDIRLSTPKTDFKSLFSLVPGAYTDDFKSVKAAGSFRFSATAKGKYYGSETNPDKSVYPSLLTNLVVENGSVQYPSLPLGISQFNLDLTANLPGPTLNTLKLDIPAFALQVGNNQLNGHFFLKTPVTNPTVDLELNGQLNLADLSKAIPMEGVQEFTGSLRSNLALKASKNQMDAGQYEQMNVKGSFDLEQMRFKAEGQPAVYLQQLNTVFSPQKVEIKQFSGQIGKSDFSMQGQIDNVLAYFSTKETMRGAFVFRSNRIDANELMGPETDETVPADQESAAAPMDRWDFTVDGQIKELLYDAYTIKDLEMKGHFLPNKVDISNFGLRMGESDLSGDGQINNAWNYLFDNQTLTGNVRFRSRFFDLNPFMTEEPTAGAEAKAEEGVLPVPENMDLRLVGNFDKIRYTNLDLTNLVGEIIVKAQKAYLENCTASVIGGQIALVGLYDTQDLSKPSFNMDVAMQNMPFKSAFEQFNTVQAIAPIAKLIDGKFNTALSMSGFLGKDMMPDFSTLTAAGFLETITAALNNVKPLQVMGDRLQLESLKRVNLGNTKNWFEMKDGIITLKPFDVKVGEVALRVGGTYGISTEMNCQVVAKIPKKAFGVAASSGLALLNAEAGKAGISLNQGEFINTRFDISGTMENPKVTMKVLGSDGQSTIKEEVAAIATDYVQKAKDSLNTLAQKELDKVKFQGEAAMKRVKDSLDRVKENLASQLKNQVNNQLKQATGIDTGKGKRDSIGLKVPKTVEEAQKNLEKWNPFQKKKSGN